MKRYAKILCAIFVVALLASVLVMVVGAAENENILAHANGINAVASGKTTVTKNVASNANEGLTYTYVEDKNDVRDANNVYVMIYPTTGDGWSAYTFPENVGFYVVDFDFCTGNNYYNGMTLWTCISDASGYIEAQYDSIKNNALVTKYGDEEVVVPLDTTPFAWHHMTMLYDIKNDVKVIYIDGEPVGMHNFLVTGKVPTKVTHTRLNLPGNLVNIDGVASMGIANPAASIYVANDDVTAMIGDDEYLEDIEEECAMGFVWNYDYELPTPENIYKVGETYYRTFAEALLSANSGAIEVVKSVKGTVTVDKECVVNTNGNSFNYVCPGFSAETTKDPNGNDVISFSSDATKYNIEYYVKGALAKTEELKVGSVLTPPVAESYFEGTKYFCFKGWATTEGGEVVTLTPAAADAKYYAVFSEVGFQIISGGAVKAEYPVGTELSVAINAAAAGDTIKFFADASSYASNLDKTITFDLNGHTFISSGRFTPTGTSVITVMNGNVLLNGAELFYCSEGAGSENATIILKDLVFSKKAGTTDKMFFELREGTAILDNVTVEEGGFTGGSQALISLGHRANGNEPGKINLTIKNSNINVVGRNFAHLNMNSQNTQGFNLKITVENSNIIAATAFYMCANDAGAAAVSTADISVDGKTTIIASSSVITTNSVLKAATFNFAEGAVFSKLPAPTQGTVVYPEGFAPAFNGTNYVVTDTYYTVNFVDGAKNYTSYYSANAAVTAPIVGTALEGIGYIKFDGGVTYVLKGWATTEGGEVVTVAPATADATYYAVWEAQAGKYTVNFYNGTTLITSAEYILGQTPEIPQVDNTIVKEGVTYAFSGWATTEGGAVVTVAPITENANYYVVYNEVAYSVTTKDGKVTYYTSSQDFIGLVNIMPAESTLTLYIDATMNSATTVGKTVTIDLNGHTITTIAGAKRFGTNNSTKMTFKNGKFVINAGTELVHMMSSGAEVTIKDCELVSAGRHFIELRTGKLTLDNLTIKEGAPISVLISAVYRTNAKNVELVVKNSNLNLGTNMLINGTSDKTETVGYDAIVTIENSTIVYTGTGTIIGFNTNNASNKNNCTATININAGAKIYANGSALAAKGGNTKTLTVNIADGAMFSKAPVFTNADAVNYPEGAKALASGDATFPVVVTTKFVTLTFTGVGAVDYLLDADIAAPELGPTKVEGDKTYKFLGWATTEGATAPEVLGKATANVTFYQVWEDISEVKYTVVFVDGENTIASTEYGSGATIILPEYARVKKVGDKYYYYVWSETVDGAEANISTANENVTYYAVWAELYFTVKVGDVVTYYGTATDLHATLQASAGVVPANATVTLYADFDFGTMYANSAITPVAGIVLDLNGFTMTMGASGGGRFANPQMTFKNGKICVRSNIFYSDKATTCATFENVEIFNYEGQGSDPVDIRSGTVIFDNCNVHDIPRYLVHMGYRVGGLNKVVIKNSTIVGNKNNYLFQSGTVETKPLQIEIEISNSTVINTACDVMFNVTIADETCAKASTVSIKIDANSKIGTKSASFVQIGGALTKDQVTFTAEEGARFNKGLTLDAAKINAVLGDGTYVVAMVDRSAYPFSVVKSASSITWDADVDKYDKTELWATGIVPVIPGNGKNYKFVTTDEVVAVAGDATYVGTYEITDIEVLQNLTLYTDVTFNVFIKNTPGILGINLNGMACRFAEAEKWGDYYKFSLPAINPIEAGKDIVFYVWCEGPNGNIEYTYNLSVVKYAKALFESENSDASKTLAADLINYIDAAFVAYGKTADAAYAQITALAEFVAQYETKNVTVPETDASMEAVKDALESAQLYLDSSAKLRFNIKAGYNGTITLNYLGKSDEFTVVDGKVGENAFIEVDLRAYDLTTTIEVVAGEATGNYNIAAYAKAVQGTAYEALVEALYAYANSAAAYKALISE